MLHAQTKDFAAPMKYDLRAHGIFYDSPTLLNVAMLRGINFDFNMDGVDLSQSISLKFMNKTCFSVDVSIKLF